MCAPRDHRPARTPRGRSGHSTKGKNACWLSAKRGSSRSKREHHLNARRGRSRQCKSAWPFASCSGGTRTTWDCIQSGLQKGTRAPASISNIVIGIFSRRRHKPERTVIEGDTNHAVGRVPDIAFASALLGGRADLLARGVHAGRIVAVLVGQSDVRDDPLRLEVLKRVEPCLWYRTGGEVVVALWVLCCPVYGRGRSGLECVQYCSVRARTVGAYRQVLLLLPPEEIMYWMGGVMRPCV